MNLLSKSQIWIAASFLVSLSIFGETDQRNRPSKSFERKREIAKNQMIPAINAPARVEIQDAWDIFATGSFIYWQAQEENLELGYISKNDPPLNDPITDTPFSTIYPNSMEFVNPHFTYRPGFKFGLGANLPWDHWEAFAEYTWFHSTIATSVAPLTPATTFNPPNGEFLYPLQGNPETSGNAPVPLFFSSADQEWTLKVDLLDLTLAQSYYEGTKLTMHPYFGVRGAWIRQFLSTDYSNNLRGTDESTSFFVQTNDTSISWGVGPLAGLDSNWLLGYGFRLLGNASADVLYTRYHLRLNETTTSLFPGITSAFEKARVNESIDYLRAHADLEMGFGWGSYFDNENWHIDLIASYGFQVFWDQNMFRNYLTNYMPAKSIAPNGNLYIHGMTLNAKLDF